MLPSAALWKRVPHICGEEGEICEIRNSLLEVVAVGAPLSAYHVCAVWVMVWCADNEGLHLGRKAPPLANSARLLSPREAAQRRQRVCLMLFGRLLCLAASSLCSCAAASFFGAAEDSPGLRPAALAAGQLWIGHYTCHTPAWLLLHIEMVNATGLRAVFQFVYPSTAQTGSFLMHGTFGSGGVVKLLSGKWIDQPPGNVVPVSLLGVLQPSGLTYRGEVLHTGCGSFEVNRSAFDLGDPFSAPTLSLPGAALCAHARAIECRSRAVRASSWPCFHGAQGSLLRGRTTVRPAVGPRVCQCVGLPKA